jgi:hypothetical protein
MNHSAPECTRSRPLARRYNRGKGNGSTRIWAFFSLRYRLLLASSYSYADRH